jgi:hypothetical protein
MFLFNKIGEQEDGTGSSWKQGGGGRAEEGKMAQTMYTHVSKCKNNKRKKKSKNICEHIYISLFILKQL